MFSTIGNLSKYWHVIALASEVKRGKSLKRSLYGVPLLIWQDHGGCFHVLADCCAHKQAPLEVKDFTANRVVCPYHGWEFSQNGSLVNVPSSPGACEKLKCSVPGFRVLESAGFVWVYLGNGTPENEIPSLDEFEGAGWSKKYKSMSFETTEELLIDNFMDPTHTALVHSGLIRSSGSSMDHELTITTHQHGVRVDFDEREERVGPGMNLIFGRSVKVKHSDEFLFPNLVKVTYWFNGAAKFIAFIACTPTSEIDGGQTQAFVQLRYRFGVFNYLASPVLSVLAHKVLKQDFDITKKQFNNANKFRDLNQHLVAADAVAARVTRLRKLAVSGDAMPPQNEQKLNLRF